MQLRYLGHSCFLLDTGGFRVLFDPYITPSPLAKSIDVDALEVDFILLSHGHFDHIHDVERVARRTGAPVLTIAETSKYLRRQGLEEVIGANVGGVVALPFGRVRLVAAAHSNGLPDGSYGGPPVGFVVEAAGQVLYFAGDTGLTQELRTLTEWYPTGLDVALLPVGGHYTMDVTDALVAARWCGARQVVGMHFDTFPPIRIDHAAALAQAEQAGLPLRLPAVGDEWAV